jgi:hypothetical protein
MNRSQIRSTYRFSGISFLILLILCPLALSISGCDGGAGEAVVIDAAATDAAVDATADVAVEAGSNPATATANGGIGMRTENVENRQEGQGDGSRLFAGRWEMIGTVKMVKMGVRISTFWEAASQENLLCEALASIYCRKLPTTFVGRGSYGKFRSI